MRLELTESPFVDDGGVAGVVEDAGCDPRLNVIGEHRENLASDGMKTKNRRERE